eukprot:Pgem_evm2s12016
MFFQSTLIAGLVIANAKAMFTVNCGFTMKSRLDPIVSPGGSSGHEHLIAGGSGFKATMTAEDAIASECTSCDLVADKSNYW